MEKATQADLAFNYSADPEGTQGTLNRWDPAKWPVAADWAPVVDTFFASATGQRLAAFITQRLEAGAVIYPPNPLRALAATPLASIRAVILGQDPYHGPGQAEGLAFSVTPGIKRPPSLHNIFKELAREGLMPTAGPSSGSLMHWARHGVLLLNASLTVEAGEPASHSKRGWEILTDAILMAVAQNVPACAYLLWGAHAQSKAALIRQNAEAHGREALLLQANHPSPLSALRPPVPFTGCGHFLTAQEWLAERGLDIDWALP